ncbi:E3 ubiquitin-protein ligase ATL41 [Heracleum sosnowskyi]|uniref:RING-type E3 ubiquitin transferase n=1 Tax=Heracleum sosnowskyi TaxID=360622 RepID=A0AAD8IMT9_9APIA|nr:E3 ubiquitin-protein ligase ATL41 [Heracleum sosnowskyi]
MDPNDNGPGRSYNLRGKMLVIVIVSLSTVVLLVTLIFIYVRCVLCCQARRRTALGRLGLTHEPKTGLDPTIIISLPTFVFKQDQMALTIECAVCLNNLEDGEMTRCLPNCEHNFHVDCIDTWLSTNTTCPICRTAAEPIKVVLEPAAATPETALPLDDDSAEKTAEDFGKVLVSSR